MDLIVAWSGEVIAQPRAFFEGRVVQVVCRPGPISNLNIYNVGKTARGLFFAGCCPPDSPLGIVARNAAHRVALESLKSEDDPAKRGHIMSFLKKLEIMNLLQHAEAGSNVRRHNPYNIRTWTPVPPEVPHKEMKERAGSRVGPGGHVRPAPASPDRPGDLPDLYCHWAEDTRSPRRPLPQLAEVTSIPSQKLCQVEVDLAQSKKRPKKVHHCRCGGVRCRN
eukprot:GHVU01150599.1.p1 GENE.GHVU01150599.1~~GHVU01150599.1.p1  ORF type:complete len:222 (+),score=8.01 GHVU01150599.1:154-819(+)